MLSMHALGMQRSILQHETSEQRLANVKLQSCKSQGYKFLLTSNEEFDMKTGNACRT
jgi:hypothetical protein